MKPAAAARISENPGRAGGKGLRAILPQVSRDAKPPAEKGQGPGPAIDYKGYSAQVNT